jgi:nucleotide-binding universal stress UspA family protein
MYKRILLTLDTSGFAEVAIPHAVQMTNAFDAELCLLSVVPVIGVGEAQTMGLAATVEWEAEVAHTEEYLAGVQKALKADGINAEIELRRGNVAEEIMLFAVKCEADLIIMSTHGRSGLGRWVYGSVTDRVLRYADVPVLLIRATEEHSDED